VVLSTCVCHCPGSPVSVCRENDSLSNVQLRIAVSTITLWLALELVVDRLLRDLQNMDSQVRLLRSSDIFDVDLELMNAFSLNIMYSMRHQFHKLFAKLRARPVFHRISMFPAYHWPFHAQL